MLIVPAPFIEATVAGPGEINATHLAADELDAINQSVELQCLVQEHVDFSLYGNSSEFCSTSFDSILCWPRTPRGTLAALPCLNEFQGIQYDSTRLLLTQTMGVAILQWIVCLLVYRCVQVHAPAENSNHQPPEYKKENKSHRHFPNHYCTKGKFLPENATRYCYPNGTWERYTNYDLCLHLPAPSTVPEFEPIIELPTIIYYVGYTLSLVSLTLAVLVFIYFKELRCLRNSIHANLFFTYIMSGLLWILTLSVQISMRTGLGGCIVLVTVFHFFTLTNFFWMLVEGLYLYMLVVKTFSGDNIRFNIYALIGWGGPAVFVAIWSIAKGVTTSFASAKIDTGCPWMHETAVDWIFQGPVCVVLIMNLIFLLRIMWVLITKLRSANTVETRQYRKAAKALLVLIPLFGITYLVVLAGPNESGVVSNIFAVIRAVLLSTQGFSVSLFYCFLNSEVRNALRHYISRWQDERNIRLGQLRQSRRFTTKSNSHSKDYSPRTRTESISIRPLTSYYGKGKRESCVSSATTTTLLGQHPPMSLQRGSNGALHMLPTPRAISPLMKQGLDENAV